MSGLERKQVGANQSAAILFNGSSALLPVTRQKIVKLCETLKRDKLTPWYWFNSRGVKVTRYDGDTIDISGTLYGQSQALVFFSFIVPFLQDAIVKTLYETLETCRARGLMPEEPYIRETAMLLDGYLIGPIYRYMADIDQRIRGKGNPKSVGRKNVTDEITEMVKFLDERKDEMIQGIKTEKPSEIEQKATHGKLWRMWTWLKNHPNSYGLQGSIIFLIPSLIVGLFKPQWRNWCWGTAVMAFLVLILSLLGGRSSR